MIFQHQELIWWQILCSIFNQYGFETEVICASIRHPIHVIECARLGADIATVPYQIIMQNDTTSIN